MAVPRTTTGRLLGAAQWLLLRLAETTLAGLALLTLADVLGRYVFSASVEIQVGKHSDVSAGSQGQGRAQPGAANP